VSQAPHSVGRSPAKTWPGSRSRWSFSVWVALGCAGAVVCDWTGQRGTTAPSALSLLASRFIDRVYRMYLTGGMSSHHRRRRILLSCDPEMCQL